MPRAVESDKSDDSKSLKNSKCLKKSKSRKKSEKSDLICKLTVGKKVPH